MFWENWDLAYIWIVYLFIGYWLPRVVLIERIKLLSEIEKQIQLGWSKLPRECQYIRALKSNKVCWELSFWYCHDIRLSYPHNRQYVTTNNTKRIEKLTSSEEHRTFLLHLLASKAEEPRRTCRSIPRGLQIRTILRRPLSCLWPTKPAITRREAIRPWRSAQRSWRLRIRCVVVLLWWPWLISQLLLRLWSRRHRGKLFATHTDDTILLS